MRKNKEKQAYHMLLRTDEALDPYQSLPVHELPEVKRQAKAEYRKKNPLYRRLGRAALDNAAGVTLILTNPRMFVQTAEQNKALAHKGRSAAARRFSKAYHRSEEDARLRRETRANAVAQAREKHPNIAIREDELRAKWRQEQAEKYRRKVLHDTAARTRRTIDYFQSHNASSLISTIPRRGSEDGRQAGFDGDYQRLAVTALSDAMARKQADGTIPLLGLSAERQRIGAQEAAGASAKSIAQSESSYLEGASTALWKLGFIDMSDERQIASASGKFNPDIEWGRSDSPHAVTASLAFDPTNELHSMLLPEGAAFASPRIELEMASDPHDPRLQPYMNVRVVEAAAPALAAAA